MQKYRSERRKYKNNAIITMNILKQYSQPPLLAKQKSPIRVKEIVKAVRTALETYVHGGSISCSAVDIGTPRHPKSFVDFNWTNYLNGKAMSNPAANDNYICISI